MLKGAGLEILYPNLLALAGFAFVLVAVSAWRFDGNSGRLLNRDVTEAGHVRAIPEAISILHS